MIKSSLTSALWSIAAVTVLAICGCKSSDASEDVVPDRSLSKTEIARGTTSGVMERGVRVIRSQAELDALWEVHGRLEYPTPSAPPVDFESSMVVAVFMGQCMSGGHSIAIDEVEAIAARDDEPARIAVRVRETSPEPGDVATMAITSPFDIVLVRRVDGELTLSSEEDSDG